jgi:hypothetical protein
MRPLSATDAISPAWNHTRRLLLAPRNWGLALKICLVAFFAQVGGCNSSFNSHGGHVHQLPPALAAGIVGLALMIGLIAFAIGLALFYLGSRLQFVLFEIVLRSDTKVAPIWSRYGRATWHWMGLKVLYFLAAIVCLSPFIIPIVIHFIHVAGPTFNSAPHNVAAFIMSMLSFIGAIFFIILAMSIGFILLVDFGVPSMALESTSMSETVQRVWSLVRAEPGQVILYLLMRFLLGLAGSIVASVGLAIGAMIAAIPLGGAGALAWLSLRHAGLAGHVLMVGSWVVLGLVLAVLVILAAIMVFGYIYTFLQAYALYFLGGRYPLVGQYLEPFLPPVYAYPPTAPVYPNYPPPPAPPSLPVEGEP